ncbi:MAG: hypothetical protein EBS05_18090 [Proteobacteria bacterium]|nr:hypothetical protein [Pseudomonadota bacterium]
MRTLRHDLRTPINPLLGYCELIVEESGEAAPAEFLAGVRNLHALGVQMLKLTNEVFSDQPSALHELDCAKLQQAFCAPAKAAIVLSQQLEQQARAGPILRHARGACIPDRMRGRVRWSGRQDLNLRYKLLHTNRLFIGVYDYPKHH